MIYFVLLLTIQSHNQSDTEIKLVHELQAKLMCDNIGTYEHENIHCYINYKGFKIEFSDIKSHNERKIYIHSLSKGQSATNMGFRCLEVAFRHPHNIHARHIIFRDDGHITYAYKNETAYNQCWSRR